MKISLLVLQSPDHNLSCQRALKFTKAAIRMGHHVQRVFFYGDGTLNGHPQFPIAEQWRTVVSGTTTELILCSSSAETRGIYSKPDATNNSVAAAPDFELSGLGQLLEASMQSHRLITFG